MRTTPPALVTPLDRGDCRQAGEVLGRAFGHDPLWSVLMPDVDLRGRMFGGLVKMVVASGGIVERTANFEGVALWLPPGRAIGLGAVVRSRFAPMRWLPKTPRRDLKRMLGVQRQIASRRKALDLEPRWELMVLGVDPRNHGRGIGSTLVRAGLRKADREGAPVYVDTSAKQNVGFYRRFGFEVIDTLTLDDPRVPFWIMLRPRSE